MAKIVVELKQDWFRCESVVEIHLSPYRLRDNENSGSRQLSCIAFSPFCANQTSQ